MPDINSKRSAEAADDDMNAIEMQDHGGESLQDDDTNAIEMQKPKLKRKSWIRRFTSHLDWNEAIAIGTNKPEGRTWTNVAEVVINAWCAGYYQAYCHQHYSIFPGTMTGNSWSALRETQKEPFTSLQVENLIFKMSCIVCWFIGNFTGMEIMRHITPGRAVFLKWFDIFTILIVGSLERWVYDDTNDYSNPIKNMMMIISFGSGMATVYFRLIYGVVTNRLTGNVYRLARGAQDIVHGTNDCPNAALTLVICTAFLGGLYTFYAPWAKAMGLLLPVLVTVGWEVIETCYEGILDDGFVHEDEELHEQAQQNDKIQSEIEGLENEVDANNQRIELLKTMMAGDSAGADAQAKLAAMDDDDNFE